MPLSAQSFKSLALGSAVALSGLGLATPAVATEPFIGEIRTFGFNFCPRGWMPADGQLLQISEFTALFSLFGTTYGGDGRVSFALPDLRGRVEMNRGDGPGLSSHGLGERGGQETVTLTTNQIPAHSHSVLIAQSDEAGDNGGLTVSQSAQTGMVAGGTDIAGGGQPHSNMPPFVILNKCVAVQGVFPPRG